jgi:hypothetical protein
VDRLHHVDHDETEWRLTQEPLTDATDRCGHPECFQNAQLITDGGEEIALSSADYNTMGTFVDAIANQVGATERVTADARDIGQRALENNAGQHSDDEIAASALYLAALIHDADLSQRTVVDLTKVSKDGLREAYLDIGNDPELLPNWYVDTSEPEVEEEEEETEADDSESEGIIRRIKSVFVEDQQGQEEQEES